MHSFSVLHVPFLGVIALVPTQGVFEKLKDKDRCKDKDKVPTQGEFEKLVDGKRARYWLDSPDHTGSIDRITENKLRNLPVQVEPKSSLD